MRTLTQEPGRRAVGSDVSPIRPRATAQERRNTSSIRQSDVLAYAGAIASAASLTALIVSITPITGTFAPLVLGYALFLVGYGVLVSFDEDTSMVRARLAAAVILSLALVLLGVLVLVVGYCVIRGFTALHHANFYSQDMGKAGPLDPLTVGGIKHAAIGTIEQITIALAITVPLGITCAVFLNEFPGRLARFVRTIVEAMTALPSIVAGLFIYATFIIALGNDKSGFAAALALSVMMLPIIIRAADVVLRLVPGHLKEASYALGSSHWRTVWHVVLPTTRSGLTTAVILGTARGIGETSPVLLTAGFNNSLNSNPFKGPQVSLPLQAFMSVKSPQPEMIARGFGTAAFLLLLVLTLFVIARIIGGRGPGQLSNRQRRTAAKQSGRDLERFKTRAGAAVVLLAILAASSVLPAGRAEAASKYVPISGAGSTWSQNALDQWRRNVTQYGMQVNYQGTGSSDGRNQFRNGTVDFAVSEIPYGLTDGGVYDQPPSRKFAYMPIVAGGTAFMYNLKIAGKRVTNLRLSGENVAKIFTGNLTTWNDPAIKQDNPGLALPARRIVPVVRSDGSGTTAQLTTWLSKRYASLWDPYCKKAGRSTPCGITSNYPVVPGSGFTAQSGSLGVSGYVSQDANEGTITYVEYSYALNTKFPVVKLLNQSGYYVEPTPQNVAVGLLQAKINTDESSQSYLTQILDGVYANADRRAYPLSSYSYMVVPTKLEGSFNEDKGSTLSAFANYFLCEGQQQAPVLGYSPLPINLVKAGLDQVKRIPGADTSAVNIAKCNNPTFSSNGQNTLAKNAPYPPACDKAGTTQCATGTGGDKTPTTTTGGTTDGTSTDGTSTDGTSTDGTGTTGGTTDGTAAGGKPGKNAGAAGGASGAPVTDGTGGTIDPDTGAVVDQAAGGGQAIAADPTMVSSGYGGGSAPVLMVLALLVLLLVVAAPPVVSQYLRKSSR